MATVSPMARNWAIRMADGADEMIVSSSIGLFDVVFRKGNTLAGANGATSQKPAEAFARALAKSMPGQMPLMGK